MKYYAIVEHKLTGNMSLYTFDTYLQRKSFIDGYVPQVRDEINVAVSVEVC